MKNITIKSLRNKQEDRTDNANDFFKKSKNDIDAVMEKPYEAKKIKKFLKIVFFTIFVLVIGGIGGILINRFVFPFLLIKYPSFNQYEFFKNMNKKTVVIEKTEKVIISENKDVVNIIKKVSPSIVQILDFSEDTGKYNYTGNGTILTNDGLIIVSMDSITLDRTKSGEKNHTIKVKLKNGKIYETKLVKIDLSTGLAIIKIDVANLSVIPLANSDDIELGENIIIIGDSIVTDIVSKFVNDYNPSEANSKNVSESTIQKRIKIVNSLKNSFNGSPVIDSKGEIIGISQGGDLFIPTNEIKSFIKDAMNKNS